jgi:tripartite-type tricarboxylate transporter receptor subunit TctC
MTQCPKLAFLASMLVLVLVGAPRPGFAQKFPDRPVTIIVPSSPGNGPDIIIRSVAPKLAERWGQQVVIINRPGAGGLIGAQAAIKAEPGGYTLYMPITSSLVILPVTQTLPFDLNRSFVPIGLVAEQPMVIGVAPSLGVSTLSEFIALAKAKPNSILYGATTRGSLPHLTTEYFCSRAGIELTFVPYSTGGTPKEIIDVMGGRLSMLVEALPPLRGAIEAGSLKALAVATPSRLPNYPTLPTVAETIPGFRASGWSVLVAPAGTPDDVIRKINVDLREVLQSPEMKRQFEQQGTLANPLSPEETGEFIRSEQNLWHPVLRQVGFEPQ